VQRRKGVTGTCSNPGAGCFCHCSVQALRPSRCLTAVPEPALHCHDRGAVWFCASREPTGGARGACGAARR
jgi:hypothetical protein